MPLQRYITSQEKTCAQINQINGDIDAKLKKVVEEKEKAQIILNNASNAKAVDDTTLL